MRKLEDGSPTMIGIHMDDIKQLFGRFGTVLEVACLSSFMTAIPIFYVTMESTTDAYYAKRALTEISENGGFYNGKLKLQISSLKSP
jgi:hypothetical protein